MGIRYNFNIFIDDHNTSLNMDINNIHNMDKINTLKDGHGYNT